MTIVITLPYFLDGEGELIVRHLHQIEYVHIRKPESTERELENLIMQIPQEYHPRLVLHDHHGLAAKHGIGGIHLNSRNPLPPAGWTGRVSRSCHSIEEVKEWKAKCDYVSLSPIFDSISKSGYNSAFSKEELLTYSSQGIIDTKVMALGGVTFDRLDEVKSLGFGGAMILGDAWRNNR
ncbi:MAG: thiamine phosphate synthase [Bacteroidaceae bacterium]|nr:thiamine phosphate synthase [Bacteroidaceae bacterium]